ncbi:PfkB family carbohydrate kinase [Jhaorihella thermophila]
MPHLLSIGECMVELAPAGADTFRMGFAGDTFNTAWYARRLLPPDWRVGYCTRVGTDAISDRMVQFIDDAGIENADIARDPDRTVGLYMIQTEDGERHFFPTGAENRPRGGWRRIRDGWRAGWAARTCCSFPGSRWPSCRPKGARGSAPRWPKPAPPGNGWCSTPTCVRACGKMPTRCARGSWRGGRGGGYRAAVAR